MSLHLHRAERADHLAEGLAGLLRQPLADPFAEEYVVVPARGVERWLAQRLSHRLGTGASSDGVCAGVRFVAPNSLISLLLDRDRDDRWAADQLTWPMLAALDEVLDEPWATVLARHLGHDPLSGVEDQSRRDRRWSLARRLAGLVSGYGIQRPELLADWIAGGSGDGLGGDLPHDLHWQPELVRRLVRIVDAPAPPQRLAEALTTLRSGTGAPDLPPRLSLFGHTRIAESEFGLLQALATHVDVHLWLPQPSLTLWEQLRETSATGPVLRTSDASSALVGHPLLASLGRDSRELQRTLGSIPVASDTATAGAASPDTLLGWLQADLRAAALPSPRVRELRLFDPAGDGSLQVHACHGPSRQIDVLREVLVGLLADDPTLEPRDILVMCPDIEMYAPLVAAGFGLVDVTDPGSSHPAHELRVRLADRSLVSTNPLLALASTLVHLAGSRMTATELLDLAASEPVRLRFGFDDDALARIESWVAQSGIRWGLDGRQREQYGLAVTDNTWRRGLDRILLGVAMSEQSRTVVGGTLPVDDVASGDLDVAGRLAEFVDRLATFLHACETASSVTDWFAALGEAVNSLAAAPADLGWQTAQFEREMSRMGALGGGTRLRLADLRALLDQRLGGRPTRSNFRTGTLTVSTLVPMRSVPHRVVCLVGIDDGAFPRVLTPDGDDALARSPRTGERDPRAEDRQLFLDAVLAATETLVITYSGAGEQTGLPKPPAVPLGELLDALDATATLAPHAVRDASATTRSAVCVQHPLQPFDARNLVRGALREGHVFSFDTSALAGATAARQVRAPARVLVPEPLGAEPPEDISLADLRDFFAHPVKFFLKQRLGLSGHQQASDIPTGIPIKLDGLETWAVGDRILSDVLGGLDPQASMWAELHRGHLPPGALGDRALRDVVTGVKPLHAVASQFRTGEPRALDVDLALRDGRRLTGTVTDVFGNNLVRVSYSSLGAKHRLAAWVDLLALRLGHEDESWVSHAIGRFGKNARHAQVGPLDETATTCLHDLVDLYDRGRREPLPLPLKTSLAWAEEDRRRMRGMEADPETKAAKEWVTDHFAENPFPREQDDIWHARAFGAAAPLSVLLGAPRPDEEFNDAPTRLGQYSRQLWDPLLARERVGGA